MANYAINLILCASVFVYKDIGLWCDVVTNNCEKLILLGVEVGIIRLYIRTARAVTCGDDV